MALDQRQPSFPCCAGLSVGQFTTWPLASSKWASKKSQGESKSQMEVTGLYNLITEVTLHHFCHILFTKSSSHSRRESHNGMNTRRWGSLGVILEAAITGDLDFSWVTVTSTTALATLFCCLVLSILICKMAGLDWAAIRVQKMLISISYFQDLFVEYKYRAFNIFTVLIKAFWFQGVGSCRESGHL